MASHESDFRKTIPDPNLADQIDKAAQQLINKRNAINRKSSNYDSMQDTLAHIRRVQTLLCDAANNLTKRMVLHDISKTQDPEKSVFDEMTPKLKGSTYGSEEYKAFLDHMKVALNHHYANNSHHPEHYENGIDGMSLLDLVEMLVDWKAATERHDDGCLKRSIEINQKRFGYTDQLKNILTATAEELGLFNDKPTSEGT
jgi:hypothetical protein